MTEVFMFLIDSFYEFIDMFDSVVFEFFGYNVSIFDLSVGFIILGFVISVFWKGAKS